ncbi:hypothetical protein [Candidatus Doolittlea endobia]|uniref:N5-carboxyaminoimidazole ribonucleotide mutase n=1 Tax=Candidatus Doolittlea endobia TaxID=1778262 RepID=A0A143WT41_9ENTR|nr:N5-carboxyaminoimidazole ribonucleotide mutase [Candidatus Doolittlea endobia]
MQATFETAKWLLSWHKAIGAPYNFPHRTTRFLKQNYFGTPHTKLFSFAEQATENSYTSNFCRRRGAVHLLDMLTVKTLLPVLGVLVQSTTLSSVNSLFLSYSKASAAAQPTLLS